MAYSATLIPHLEKEDAELHATQEETSWIGETARACNVIASHYSANGVTRSVATADRSSCSD